MLKKYVSKNEADKYLFVKTKAFPSQEEKERERGVKREGGGRKE